MIKLPCMRASSKQYSFTSSFHVLCMLGLHDNFELCKYIFACQLFCPPHSTTHIFSPSVKKYVTANFIDVCIILQKQTSPFDIFHNLFNNKKQSPRYAFCYYKNRDRQNLGSMGKAASPLMTWVPSKLSRKGFLTGYLLN